MQSKLPQIIQLPKIIDRRGNLSFFEHPDQLPFEIARTYWIYDVPGGEIRGSHAFREQQEFIVALSGSFDVVLHDGKNEKRITLNQPNQGLLVVPGIWREIENFSAGAILLVLASETYLKNDYIREINNFKNQKYGINI